jgi:predicted nucleotidyltransferase
LDFTRAEATLRDVVAPVVTELELVGVDPGDLMLVGAVCRDVLHLAAGHTSSLRSTGDLDLALAVDGWATYRRITGQLEPIRELSPIRFRVAGVAVDIVPFGDLEDPDGQVPTTPHDVPMNVVGFQDVSRTATSVGLPGGSTIRVPTIPGFTVLKLSAWASRSRTGDYKDGADLARGIQRLEHAELDEPVAAVMLLIGDALDFLSPAGRQGLRSLWDTVADREDLLATYLENTRLTDWPRGERLLTYADAVRAALFDVSEPLR